MVATAAGGGEGEQRGGSEGRGSFVPARYDAPQRRAGVTPPPDVLHGTICVKA